VKASILVRKRYQQFYADFDKYLKEKTGIREIGIAINTGT